MTFSISQWSKAADRHAQPTETLLQPGNKTSLLCKMNVKTIKRSRIRRRVSRERDRFWKGDQEDDGILEQ